MKKISNKLMAFTGITSLLLSFALSIPTFADGPAIINLGTSANFVILAKTGVTTSGATLVTGDIGISPAAASSLTGFSQILDLSGKYSTSIYLTGKIYAADYSSPTPTYVGTAISDMEAAYVDGAGRVPGVGITNLNVGGGTLSGNNFVPGAYTWNGPTSDVTITGDITLTGTASDVWIFQIAGTLGLEAGQSVILAGGAKAENVFWVVAGTTTLKPGAIFEGNILGGPGASTIAMQNGAVLNGRALGQTDVTLLANTIGGGIVVVDPQLTVTKVVINDNGGTSTIADFPLFINGGSVSSGVASTVPIGFYTISETYDIALYAQTFSSNCLGGNISLLSGDDEVCTITNDDIAPVVVIVPIVEGPPPSGGSSGGGTHYGCKDPNALNYEYFSASKPELCLYSNSANLPVTAIASALPLVPTGASVFVAKSISNPSFPNAGFTPKADSFGWKTLGGWLQKVWLIALPKSKMADPGQIDLYSVAHLKIPVIKVETQILSVGLTDKGEIAVPEEPDKVAWYNLGTYPGKMGTAVIAGHSGWKNDFPAVFDNLDKLQAGDNVYFYDKDGVETIFVVKMFKFYNEKADTAELFASRDNKTNLNLVTCGGVWNEVTKSYPDRLVVFTEKAESLIDTRF